MLGDALTEYELFLLEYIIDSEEAGEDTVIGPFELSATGEYADKLECWIDHDVYQNGSTICHVRVLSGKLEELKALRDIHYL